MTEAKFCVEFEGNVVEYHALDDLLKEAEFLEGLAEANKLIHDDSPGKQAKVATQSEYALRFARAHYETAAKVLENDDRDLEREIDRINRDFGASDQTS